MADRDSVFTEAQVREAFRRLAEEQRQRETAQDTRVADLDGFWDRVLPRPLAPSLLREVIEHDHGPEAPVDAASLAQMDMIEYARNRDRLGVKDSNGILGSEVKTWQRPSQPGTSGR